MAIDVGDIIREWWDSYQADPRANYDNILSGLKKPQSTDTGQSQFDGGITEPINKSQLQTGACQYWIKGLPAPCSNWDFNTLKCKVTITNPEDTPTGYGIGKCDMLGRRDWCSKYVASKDIDLEEYVCIAPCPEKSGLGKQVTTNKTTLEFRALLPSEIKGYNQDDAGVGRCDGWGLGRGNQKETFSSLEELYDVGPICNYYRPQQMGFGALQPHPFHGSSVPGKPFDPAVNYIPTTTEELYDGSPADPLYVMDKRVPFIFQMYNARAMYQKCVHWKNSKPSFFVMSTESDVSLQSIELSGDVECSCTDSACNPYKKWFTEWPTGVPWVTALVMAEYGGVICNGAKPECPCYTGKWIYCTDNNMRDGMRITADQIFELRFWASDWESQAEYDAYYKKKPGRTFEGSADESTADIYTFTKWEKLNVTDPNESVMLGYRHTMCMPAPLQLKEFVPSMYITKTLIRYPKINSNTGTNAPGQVSFPTLVRELEDIELYIPDINVIYPYHTLDPWEVKICQQEPVLDYCVHDTNLTYNPSILFIGQSVPNCELYIINKTLLPNSVELRKVAEYLDKYNRASQIVDINADLDFNYRMYKLIEYCELQNVGYTVASTDDYGLFIVTDVELKLNNLNEFYIVCKYDDDPIPRYTFRKNRVLSKYWGAIITQSNMAHEHFKSATLSFPTQFQPGASITGSVKCNRGVVNDVLPLYSFKSERLFGDKYYYGYCINEYDEEVADVEHWVRVGSTGLIFTEIDDINLTYLYDFAITEATMTLLPSNNKKRKINLCGVNGDMQEGATITLKQVALDRKSIPPNAVLLIADKPLGFFNNDWRLSIKYKYRLLETRKVNPIWPMNMDVELGSIFFRNSPFAVNHDKKSTTFIIENIGSSTTRATAAVMANIVDSNGRIQTAAATKMLLQGYEQGNRNVEIEYAYRSPAISYKLMPDSGIATWRGADQPIQLDGHGYHFMSAYCGDHNCDSNNCIGPLWYPFDDCTKMAYYDFYTPAAQCYLPMLEAEPEIEKMGYAAWRYGTAPQYNCWVTEGGNWASSCGASWFYYYSKAELSDMQFAGVVRVVSATGTEDSYEFMKWTPPPFGYNSRAFIDRYVTRDFISYIDYSSSYPTSKMAYMPAMFCKEDLNTDIDCFGGKVFNGGEIKYFPMLSNYVAGFVSEKISSNRFRFEDAIQVVLTTKCSYPLNFVKLNNSYYSIRYCFRNESHVWAWPEYWKDMERAQDDTEKFHFLELEYPDYKTDYISVEHRFTAEEGTRTITFEPPKGGNDGSGMVTYPSISIDGGKPRFFEIRYSDYGATGSAAWKDESSIGEVGGSDGNSIYEKANNGIGRPTSDIQWMHDIDTLFDYDASEEPSTDRMFYVDQDEWTHLDTFGYYNRGLIADIPINRLRYLPMEVGSAGSPHKSSIKENEIILYWNLDGEFGVAPVNVTINGKYGVKMVNGTEEVYDRPEIIVAESTSDPEGSGTVPDWPKNSDVAYLTGIDGSDLYSTKSYEINLEVDRIPTRFIKNIKYFMVKISAGDGAKLIVEEVSVSKGKYAKAIENIKLWERKFFMGEASLSVPNMDGPNSMILRSANGDYKNSGLYFPMNSFGPQGRAVSGYENNGTIYNGYGKVIYSSPISVTNSSLQQSGSAISKTDLVSYTKYTQEPEVISGVTLGNLKDKEISVQADEFSKATSLESHDQLNFSAVMHPYLSGYMKEINSSFAMHSAMVLQYNKIQWDNSGYATMVNQKGDFWQPGGHYFGWADTVLRTKCFYLGPVQTLYQAEFLHPGHAHTGDEVMWTGYAYAGWGRIQYQEAKYWQAKNLGLDVDTTPDLMTQARNGIMGQA